MAKVVKVGEGMANASRAIQRWLGSNPQAATQAGTRIGLRQLTPAAVLQAAKDNPVTTALVLMEAGAAGSAALDALLEEFPELQDLVQQMGHENDMVEPDTHVLDLPKFEDEFECITNAARSLGGMDRLMNLRRAIEIDSSVYALYDQIRTIKRVF